MGATAEFARNHAEALSYYNRVLEADPTVSAAWAGRGRAAGWLSTLADLRIVDALVAFGHAIATADDAAKARVAEQAVADLTTLVEALYALARRHFETHGDPDGARLIYVSTATRLSDALAEVAGWAPGYRPALDATVMIARDVLDAGVDAALAATLRERMERAAAAIRARDPDYRAPALAARTLLEQEADAAAIARLKAKEASDFQLTMVAFLFIAAIVAGLVSAGTL
jgi:uncharacterized protein (DUF1501 family)